MEGNEGGARSDFRSRGLSKAATIQQTWNGAERACRGATSLFYGEYVDLREEPQEEREEREERCVAICATCSIIWPCLRWALTEKEPWGVWGGMGHRERQRFAKFLRSQGYGEIPDEQTIREEVIPFFRQEQLKREGKQQPKAQVVSITRANRNGTRPATVTGDAPRAATASGRTGMRDVRGNVPRAASGASQSGQARTRSSVLRNGVPTRGIQRKR